MSTRKCDVCELQKETTHYVPANSRFECQECDPSIPHPPTWPGYIDNRQCDCGGYHSPADCPNTIVEWNGWQA